MSEDEVTLNNLYHYVNNSLRDIDRRLKVLEKLVNDKPPKEAKPK